MAKTREQKQQTVEALVKAFDQSKLVVLCDYQGLNVASVSDLRSKLRDQNSSFTVAKNSLVKIALANSKKAVSDTEIFSGPIGLAFSQDEVTAAKVVYEFTKTNESLEILGGINEDGQVMESDEIVALAKLPTKPELIAQVVGTVAAPMSSFVRVVNANLSGLVYALKAIQEQKTT